MSEIIKLHQSDGLPVVQKSQRKLKKKRKYKAKLSQQIKNRFDILKQSTFSVMTGNISINTILYSWLQDFQSMGNQSKVCIKSSRSYEYALERYKRRRCTYLVYVENGQISAWAEVTKKDFRNAGGCS